jgi:hypothetical protein
MMAGGRLLVGNLPGVLRASLPTAWSGTASLAFYGCAVVMTATLVLGGGTVGGFLSDAVLQLLAIPLLLLSLWKMFEVPLTKQMRRAAWFCLAIAMFPLIQLIPLPPWLWTTLPHRQPSAEAFDILGQAVAWMPISVSPELTWLSVLSLIPPLAIFLGTLLLTYRERRLLILVVLAVGTISVFVGLVQVAQGPESPLRFFEITNPTEAVGFFANRNHFAALLYCLLVFSVAWAAQAAMAIKFGVQPKEYDFVAIVGAVAGFILLVALLAAQAMARSRAGLGLTMVALFCAIGLGFSNRRPILGITPKWLVFSAIAVAAMFAVEFALYRILDRFTFDPLETARHAIALTTIEAAKAYLPLGSGLGTFVPVYAMFEKTETITNAYVNRAHSDVLEMSLEAGLPGIAMMGLFVIWLVRRSVDIWRNGPPRGANELDWSLARAATIVTALVMVHSFVDYPLRTGAMAAVIALACALLMEPPVGVEPAGVNSGEEPVGIGHHDPKPKPISSRAKSTVRSLRPSKRASGQARLTVKRPEQSEAPSPSPHQRWGADIQWPEEWTKSTAAPPNGKEST